MNQIHIYIQEVVGGDKIVYTTDQGASIPKEISDIRVELQQLQVSTEQTVLRVAYSFSHVCITIAKPSRLGRSGDYEAVWVLIPGTSAYSALEGGHFAEVIRDLESRIKSVSRPLWSELKAMDVEIDSPKGQIRASNERTGLAYRLYDEAEGYDELLKKLVQSEYSEYKAVYFLPSHLKPVGAGAKDLTTTPLRSTCILQPPAEPLGGVRLLVDDQVLREAKRYSSGQRLRVRWENPPYDPIEQTITIEPEKEVLRLTKPEKKEWQRSLDLAITPTFAGQPVQARMKINDQEPKYKYSQEEWEQGLKLSFHHQDYRGPEEVHRLNGTIFSYEFTERRLSSSYLEELGYKRGQELTIDGEVFHDELWKDKAWWQSRHIFKLGKKTSELSLNEKRGLTSFFKTKAEQPKSQSGSNLAGHSNAKGAEGTIPDEQLAYYEELNRFKPRTWRIIAIACAISLLLNIGLLGYLLYGYFTPSGEKPETELSTDGAEVADSQQTLDTESLDRESLISEIKRLRKEFRDQVYKFGNKDLVSVNKKHHEELKKLGFNLDSLSPNLEQMNLDSLKAEHRKLENRIGNVREYADQELKAENDALAAKIQELNGAAGTQNGSSASSGTSSQTHSNPQGNAESASNGSGADGGK